MHMQASLDNIIVGSHVWVEDPVLAWIDGEVFKINGNEVHVHTTNGKTVCVQSIFWFILFSHENPCHQYCHCLCQCKL